MKIILAVFLVLLLLPMATPTDAQDDGCDISLTQTYVLLSQAMVALDQGDDQAALQAISGARAALQDIENTCSGGSVDASVSECASNVEACVQITGVSINGQVLSHGGTLSVPVGTALRLDSVGYSINSDALETIRASHGGLSYGIVYAFPSIDGEPTEDSNLTQGTANEDAIPTLTAQGGSIAVTSGQTWIVEENWTRINILFMHENPPGSGNESPIGRAVIHLDIQ